MLKTICFNIMLLTYMGTVNCPFPIGHVIDNGKNDFNPNAMYPGTVWTRIKGYVIVGVDEDQSEFNSINKVGGHKSMQSHSHTGSIGSAGNHAHGFQTPYQWETLFNTAANFVQGGNTYTSAYPYGSSTPSAVTIKTAGNHSHTVSINSAGSGNSQNLQPYVTKYMWERIS